MWGPFLMPTKCSKKVCGTLAQQLFPLATGELIASAVKKKIIASAAAATATQGSHCLAEGKLFAGKKMNNIP